jgi:methylenetetrahydrofolate reductase (NADPH)
MKISDMLRNGRPTVSFEFFPPKDDAGFAELFKTIAALQPLQPSYVSVTYGAGGSTRRKTVDLVKRIKADIGIESMAHVTCVAATREDIASVLDELRDAGMDNVLALRGDPPRGETKFTPTAGGFRYANELVAFVRSRYAFCIGAACYPEVHPEAPDAATDLDNLKRKVDAGVDFLITQLFFDNADYFAFLDRARAAGIDVPIVPGIMPVISGRNVRRMAALSGARIPAELASRLDAAADDDARTLEVGVEWATLQCRELLARGAPGIHFYTLNRSPAARRIYTNLF